MAYSPPAGVKIPFPLSNTTVSVEPKPLIFFLQVSYQTDKTEQWLLFFVSRTILKRRVDILKFVVGAKITC